MNFTDLMLSSELLEAVRDLGFDTPTPIQERVIPQLLNDETDVVALAQTGTGKTAAFGLPILQRLEEEVKSIQALVLCPTRELCLQITQDMKSFSKYIRGISITPVYGGAEMAQQIKSLRKGAHVVVATPGRLLDLIHRRVADIGAIRYLVLDEADIMLNMGFKEELDAILEAAPPDRQTVLLSATMPEDVARIASSYMRNTVEITIGRKNAGTASVEHGYVMVHAKDKYAALKRIVDFYPGMYGIIFCRTRQSTKEIAERMIGDGYNAEALHGDLSQAQREQVMRKFRDRGLQLLVATDIAARGLDVNDLTHILHFDLPDEPGIYTHRSGRTGRAGKTGISLVLINMKERYRIRQIEKVLQRSITEARVPLGKEICEKQLMGLIERVKTVEVDTPQIEPYMSMIEEKLSALGREELIKHFISLDFNRFLKYYKNVPDLAPVTEQREPKQNRSTKKFLRGKGTGEGDKTGFSTITLNLGKKDRVLPPQIIGLVNQCMRNRKIRVGRIDIGFTSSRVQIESYHADRVSEALCGCSFRGRTLIAEKQNTKQGRTRKTA